MPPKRIVVVSPVPTHPATTGNRARVHRLIRELRELGHEVHLIYIPDVPGDEQAMRSWLDGRLHLARHDRPSVPNPRHVRWLQRLAGGRVATEPFRLLTDVDAFLSPELERRVAALAGEIDPDVAIVTYAFYSGLLTRFGDRPTKVLDTLDRLSGRHRLFWRHGMRARGVALSRRAERRALGRADLTLAIQDEERARFARECDRPVVTVGHRIDLRPAPLPDEDEPPRLAFHGGGGIASRDIRWFTAKVLPRLRRRFRGLVLDLAGPICETNPGLGRLPGVHLAGIVDDLGKYLERADVFVNMIRSGTGVHVKNLDALGNGRPSVMHVNATRGIRDGAGRAYLVARTARGTERQIRRILEDRSFAAALGDRAYRYAAAYDARVRGQIEAFVGRA